MNRTNWTGCAALAAALAAFTAAARSTAAENAARLPKETLEQKAARMQWWTDARFGMFIHFGLYALPARHEWMKSRERLTNEDYQKYFEQFNPDLFDAKAWAKAAKAAGMKYMVLTSKHHEGFCLFDSKVTDYKITNTPFGRDLVKEFVEAARAEGLKVGFYYSLLDWHHPDYTIDKHHPLRGYNAAQRAAFNKGRDMARYRRYMKDQVAELLTNYGKIDIIWYDFSFPGKDGKGRDDWDSAGLLALTRKLQPDIIVDNRLDLNDVEGGFDLLTPEQKRTAKWPEAFGRRQPWERCQTFSGSWGYHREEKSWKSVPSLVEMLVDCVGHGGNLLLNVGPTGRGEFDYRAKERLDGLGRWMHANSRAVYGCTQPPDEYFDSPEPNPNGCCWMTWNPKTRRLYLCIIHSYPAKDGRLNVKFFDKVKYAQFLHDGSELKLGDGAIWLPKQAPNVVVPVVECVMK